MKNKFYQVVDGVGFSMRSAQRFKLACCDCGLVHDIVIVGRRGGHLGIAMRRNKRATAARRKTIKSTRRKKR